MRFLAPRGPDLEDASKGVPHGQVWRTTARRIRLSGGRVYHKPERGRNGVMNYRHVNFTLGITNPFSGPVVNPNPPGERVPHDKYKGPR